MYEGFTRGDLLIKDAASTMLNSERPDADFQNATLHDLHVAHGIEHAVQQTEHLPADGLL